MADYYSEDDMDNDVIMLTKSILTKSTFAKIYPFGKDLRCAAYIIMKSHCKEHKNDAGACPGSCACVWI